MRFLFLLLALSSLIAELPLPPNVKIEWGFLPLQNQEGKEEGQIFYTAYFQPSTNKAPRPLTFCLNGGPGASSVWLHLGGVGPLRLKDAYQGSELEKNPGSILPFTDLVFLDPISTGLSKTAPGVDPSIFHSFDSDVESLRRAVNTFLNRYEKWDAPLYLLGESYGVLRIVGLAKKLFETNQIAPRGLILISGPLDYGTVTGESTSDLPYALAFPTQAILSGFREGKRAEDVAPEAEKFLEQTYQPALFLGNALPEKDRASLAESLAKWTSVPKEEIINGFYRITPSTFRYLSNRGQVLGRFDGRVTAKAPYEIPPFFQMEPSFINLFGPFQQAIHQVLKEAGWKGNLETYTVHADSIKWDFKTNNCYLNVLGSLKELLYQLPHLQVISCNGYYDLAAPYYSVKYSLRHLLLDPKTASRIQMELFEGGHMFYLDRPVNEALSQTLKSFYRYP